MHITLSRALQVLAKTGDESEAWRIAQQDEAAGTSRARWLIFAYAALDRRR